VNEGRKMQLKVLKKTSQELKFEVEGEATMCRTRLYLTLLSQFERRKERNLKKRYKKP